MSGGVSGKPLRELNSRERLLSSLTQSVADYAAPIQLALSLPYYSTEDALAVVLRYDQVIEEAAARYDIEQEMLQAVLFQELRFLNLLDEVDVFVLATYDYLQCAENFYQLLGNRNLPLPFPPPLVFRVDSSTGLGQIFAETAIHALNWQAQYEVYDSTNWKDLRTVWLRLKTDEVYNIQMAALVLAHKRSLLQEAGGPEPTPAAIMQSYNGTGPLSEAYRDVTYEYYRAFQIYHQAN